jgi:putative spermidine/putrescine transport system permease protein
VIILLAVFVTAILVLGEFSFHRFSEGVTQPGYTVAEWTAFLTDPYVWSLTRETVILGLITTGICAVIGYATALALYRSNSPRWRSVCYFAIFSPLLTSVVARTYGWSLILGDAGFLNAVATPLHLPGTPYALLYQRPAVVIALVHILLPFMVMPVISSLGQIDRQLPAAAADLGASAWTTLRKVLFPLSLPGLVAGCQLTFALTISAFATPSLLGGGRVQVLATNTYSDVQNLNWPRASVGSFLLLALALLSLAAFAAVQRGLVTWRRR